MKFSALLVLAASLAFAASSSAQLPERPRLPRDADPNDWESYYARGDPYRWLGAMHDALGAREPALAAYRAYLASAPRRQANAIEVVQRRIAELQQQG